MKKPTLIKNGISVDGRLYNVVIGTDIGQFSGTVEIRPEDELYRSDYFGWELAEIKANIKYAKAKKQYYAAQMQALKKFWGEMSKTRTYNNDAFWVKKIEQELETIEAHHRYWKHRIDYLKENYRLKVIVFDSSKTIVARAKHKEVHPND